jgi:AraC-like DNA-binding protein
MRPSPLFTLPALRRARDLIDREYATTLDLDALAHEAGYSRFHFARAFAAAYGEPPRAYLSRRRIERAKSLLGSANLTVTEVCVLVGFESLGSFSALFKRLVGQSPSQYQQSLARAGGPPPIPGCVVMMWTRPHPQAQQSPRSDTSCASGT